MISLHFYLESVIDTIENENKTHLTYFLSDQKLPCITKTLPNGIISLRTKRYRIENF